MVSNESIVTGSCLTLNVTYWVRKDMRRIVKHGDQIGNAAEAQKCEDIQRAAFGDHVRRQGRERSDDA